jgi:hypothetical protein
MTGLAFQVAFGGLPSLVMVEFRVGSPKNLLRTKGFQ